MNRRIVMAAVLALSVGAISLFAQAPGRPGGPGRGPGGRGGPGGPGMLALVNQLDLTDAQREQIRALAEEGRQSGDPGAPVRAAEKKLHAAVLADTPDLQAIDTLKGTLSAAFAADIEHRVEMMRKVAQILTPAQRQQLLQLTPQGPPRGRGPARH
jgi:Spy/CpxP family protein refolding chaperone